MAAKFTIRRGASLKGRTVDVKSSRSAEKAAQIKNLMNEKLLTPRQIAAKKAAVARVKRAAAALAVVRRKNEALSEQADRLLERFG